MNRLNYFNSYQSKVDTHEDQLTRAYLVLLKHSFHCLAVFLDYCRSNLAINIENHEKSIGVSSLLEGPWEIDTQRHNPVIGTDWLMSVLITDSITSQQHNVIASERGARYDGILTFGSYLTIIIENKPRSGNVWLDQLNPAKEGLSEETKVFSTPAELEWKVIIRQLNNLLTKPSVSGNEQIMIMDFLALIDECFPALNPFDRFHLCKGHPELIDRRIEGLLKSVVLHDDQVHYHRGWGYYIETPYVEIRKIGLVCGREPADGAWWLELSFYFGDTQSQAKAFYQADPTLDHLPDKWGHHPNFHVAYQSTNLVWFEPIGNATDYLQFWKKNIAAIYQHKKDDVPHYLKWLEDRNIILLKPEHQHQLEKRFYDTNIPTVNICPGFGSIFEISQEEAEEMDKTDKLRILLATAITDGLRIIGKDARDILNVG